MITLKMALQGQASRTKCKLVLFIFNRVLCWVLIAQVILSACNQLAKTTSA
jgi:hypothetical protein